MFMILFDVMGLLLYFHSFNEFLGIFGTITRCYSFEWYFKPNWFWHFKL